MNVIVVDDFLPKPDFDVLHDNLMSKYDNLVSRTGEEFHECFPWVYSDTVGNEFDVAEGNWYFSSRLYEAGYVSPWFEIFKPILHNIENKLQFTIRDLIRVRANLYTNAGISKAHPDHIDQSFQHTVGMFYINTNNGPTTINGTDYDSVANRMILFDGSYMHHSNLQTDTKIRVNVNINITGAFR